MIFCNNANQFLKGCTTILGAVILTVDKKYCDILMFYECNTAKRTVKRKIVNGNWQLGTSQIFPSVPLKSSIVFNGDYNKNFGNISVEKHSVVYHNFALHCILFDFLTVQFSKLLNGLHLSFRKFILGKKSEPIFSYSMCRTYLSPFQ